MRVLVISADGFEDSELLVPWYRLQEEGMHVDIASLERRPIKGKHGYEVDAGLAIDEVRPEEYEALLVPGGRAPERLRTNAKVLEVVRAFFAAGKPVSAICHGPQVLLSAGVLSNRSATCYRTVAQELAAAGVRYEDAEVVVDENLVTSRQPSDLPAFLRETMKKLHARRVEARARTAAALEGELAGPDTSAPSFSMPLDEALARRRSVREYTLEPVGDGAISRLLWAAQGITDPEGHRTAPSAGALYPLEVYALTARGVFHYEAQHRCLSRIDTADVRPALASAAHSQSAVRTAPLILALTAIHARTAAKYGERAERYVNLEAGHAAQNVLLEATALGLGAVVVGAFDDDALARALPLPREQRPIYLIAVAHPKR